MDLDYVSNIRVTGYIFMYLLGDNYLFFWIDNISTWFKYLCAKSKYPSYSYLSSTQFLQSYLIHGHCYINFLVTDWIIVHNEGFIHACPIVNRLGYVTYGNLPCRMVCPVALSSGHVTCLDNKMWAEVLVGWQPHGSFNSQFTVCMLLSLCPETRDVPIKSVLSAWVSQWGCFESEL